MATFTPSALASSRYTSQRCLRRDLQSVLPPRRDAEDGAEHHWEHRAGEAGPVATPGVERAQARTEELERPGEEQEATESLAQDTWKNPYFSDLVVAPSYAR